MVKPKSTRRYQDIEKELPERLRKVPQPGEKPLKRPYPPYARDMRILNNLLKDVPREMPTEFPHRDLRTVTRPQGVLYFHVLDIQDIKLTKKDFIHGAPICIYVEYECQGAIKCSYPVFSHKLPKIRIDHYVHFSAEVSEIRNDEANDFVIHVYAFQNPEKHYLIGSQLLHMYNFIRDIHGITSTKIQDDLSYYSGTVHYEFAWAYGTYGFGHSNQLRNTKNPVYDSVCHSMFPRIAPSSDDLIDNKFRVRVPKKLRLLTLFSLMVRVALQDKDEREQEKKLKQAAAAEEKLKAKTKVQQAKLPEPKVKKPSPDFNKEAKTIIFRRVKYARGRPVHVSLNLDIHQKFLENDFNHSYGEFICLRNRRERLDHLTKMTEGRLRDRFESETPTRLFQPITDVKECRTVLGTVKPIACPPGYLEHKSQVYQCPAMYRDLEEGDEDKFVEKITSAPRVSGYLAHVFGYLPPPDPVACPVEKHEFKVSQGAFLGGGEDKMVTMSCCQRFRYRMVMFWYKKVIQFKNFWARVFHNATWKMEKLLPEVSVTLPSPADSTTEFYAHCTQEKVYPKILPLPAARRMAINLVRISRRKTIDDEDTTDDEGAENWDVEKQLSEMLTKHREVRGENMNPVGRDIRKSKDVRPLEHVEVSKFGKQHERPVFHKSPW